MIDKLKQFLSSLKSREKKPTKLHYIALIGLVGVFLLLVSNMFQSESTDQEQNFKPLDEELKSTEDEETWKQKESSNATTKIKGLEEAYENDLNNLLEKITGVSNVDVMVNLDATNEQVYEKNLIIGSQVTNETDQNGGERRIDDETREQTVVILRQGDQEVPLLVQTKKPGVRGVLVVATGVDNLEVKKWVIDAVSKVLDVPAHRISVMPKNK
ncbi:stage III sporulation protein AG [Gracilibacillus ureilyticus]|uniref:Stage III sporulation protein AG n=1 Tax=Gracilibacillus ureilyticus TaxID=531814 RepID=A0A1H9LX68_9BACI|nr:stage III sporulation protein AG [Gracilibacillus ureilyticus]SER16072.1 stage III sporulation protein AG [Gracilibacillus ureilyticus]